MKLTTENKQRLEQARKDFLVLSPDSDFRQICSEEKYVNIIEYALQDSQWYKEYAMTNVLDILVIRRC